MSSFYVRNNFEEGQEIETDGIKGTIKKVDSIYVIVETKEGEVLIPTKTLVSGKVTRS